MMVLQTPITALTVNQIEAVIKAAELDCSVTQAMERIKGKIGPIIPTEAITAAEEIKEAAEPGNVIRYMGVGDIAELLVALDCYA